MNIFKVYVSCPIALPESSLLKYTNALHSLGAQVSYWKRGTAYQETNNIKECDAFVMILPGENFKTLSRTIPPGCKSELNTARSEHKPIYLAYTDRQKEIKFYETDIGNIFSGIVGSSHRFLEKIKAALEVKSFYNFTETASINPFKKKSLEEPIIITVPYI